MNRKIKYALIALLWAIFILLCAIAAIGAIILVLDQDIEWKTLGFNMLLFGFLGATGISLLIDYIKVK